MKIKILYCLNQIVNNHFDIFFKEIRKEYYKTTLKN